ncbi:SigB/SigF/SigG family RNA polymerase sigma factor [Streptacidiphilus sp. ASG 303]|uniref:SigB/SigF/SigG family RNA polymerase sigma factor n=1 Tax=Streptacidiphilus sp. ASG 303 TaxID=2896847 RepID=UPI001E6583ED|nr:SigB/SigF/SigG family RNA polymerase sigma factor [Streptacidiphilus sp. ASG 303]MCD0484883.1 SigB/SigF/SigG family RNA polymerase sigma factor [Streptacidiphilus sp. ASG 303]
MTRSDGLPEQVDALLRRLSELRDSPERLAVRDEAVRSLLPLARRIAGRFRGRGEDAEDLYQVACVGLVKAVDGYDGARGHAFLSYAVPTIRGEVRRHLRDRTAGVHVPRPVQEVLARIRTARAELQQRNHGARPTAEDLAAHTGLDVADVRRALGAEDVRHTRSLDAAPAGRHGGPALADLAGAEDPGLDLAVDRVSLRPLVERLPERERRILYLRFFEDMTQRQVAEAVGLSQMHVSRLLRDCFTLLREQVLGPEGPAAGTAGPECGTGAGSQRRRRDQDRAPEDRRPARGGAPAAEAVPHGSGRPARPHPGGRRGPEAVGAAAGVLTDGARGRPARDVAGGANRRARPFGDQGVHADGAAPGPGRPGPGAGCTTPEAVEAPGNGSSYGAAGNGCSRGTAGRRPRPPVPDRPSPAAVDRRPRGRPVSAPVSPAGAGGPVGSRPSPAAGRPHGGRRARVPRTGVPVRGP